MKIVVNDFHYRFVGLHAPSSLPVSPASVQVLHNPLCTKLLSQSVAHVTGHVHLSPPR